MKLIPILGLLSVLICGNLSIAQESVNGRRAVMPRKHLAVFKKYCFDCHDAETMEGKLNLEELSFDIANGIPTAERWAKILNAINAGEMPPKDSEPISDEDKFSFLGDLSNRMVTARNILSDSGGVITIRRLNRREYQNTLEALLGFRPDVSTLPADDGTGGFDTSGASLFFSSDQFEQYRATATRALEAVLIPYEKPESRTRRIEPEEDISKDFFDQAIQAVARLEQAKAFLAQDEKPPTDFGFRDLAHVKKQANRLPAGIRELQDYVNRPEAKTGAVLVHKQNRTPGMPLPKVDRKGGRYILRIRAGAYEDAPERERYLEYAFSSGTIKNSQVRGHVKVTGTLKEPVTLEIPIDHPLGAPGTYIVRQRDYKEKVSRRIVNEAWKKKNGIGQPPSLWVDWIELEGPFHDVWPNPVRAELLPSKEQDEDEASFARRVITAFATSAFRQRTPDPEFTDKLMARYLSKSNGGANRLGAIVDAYALVLSSPSFIYLSEPRLGNKPVRLSDRELAIRLSYFLWSAPPDDELFAVAENGTLSNPKVLREQTSRLLKDPRSDAFISSFAHQWLDMGRLDMFEFNAQFHPEFDEAVRNSARGEVYATIGHLIDDGLPLETLLKADFVLVNDVLADFYELPGVEGPEFRKVSLPRGSPRGGLLGAAATHIMGSDGTRSSPVERGAWVLRHLLNDPPPPAPANVPMLSRLAGEVLDSRELQKAHQEEPQCAQCHRKIDPIGYGLENFTAAGLWRDKEEVYELPTDAKQKRKGQVTVHTFPIDPSGTLYGGETFSDYFGLRDTIARQSDVFARGFTEHLIAYGLGRPFSISDDNLAADITKQAALKNNAIDAFIHAVVQSDSFHTK